MINEQIMNRRDVQKIIRKSGENSWKRGINALYCYCKEGVRQ